MQGKSGALVRQSGRPLALKQRCGYCFTEPKPGVIQTAVYENFQIPAVEQAQPDLNVNYRYGNLGSRHCQKKNIGIMNTAKIIASGNTVS